MTFHDDDGESTRSDEKPEVFTIIAQRDTGCEDVIAYLLSLGADTDIHNNGNTVFMKMEIDDRFVVDQVSEEFESLREIFRSACYTVDVEGSAVQEKSHMGKESDSLDD